MKTTATAKHFDSFEGSLWDSRTNTVLRKDYDKHFRDIKTGAQLRATLRAGEFAWPGGYQLFFITSDGEALSFDSVRENLQQITSAIRERSRDGWRVIACDINYEDTTLTCAHSGKPIPAAYGNTSRP